MKRIELSIGTSYIKDWTVSDAVREILQNAIDQEVRIPGNKKSIDYTGDILIISNKTSHLTKASLIMGGTDKDNEDCSIGQFGEGYKLALLVLLRAGIEVVIHNYSEEEVWIPQIIKSKTFGVEVLAIDIDKSWVTKPDNNLSFVMHGIKDIGSILKKIMFNPTEKNSIKTEFGHIITIGKEAGNIYVNGLFVCKKEGLKYGYSIKPNFLKLGRDRDIVNDWDIKYRTSAMWGELYATHKDLILTNVESGIEDVKYIIYHKKTVYIGNRKTDIGSDLYDRNFSGKVPVSSEAERDLALKKYGKKVQTIITSSQVVELTKGSITIKEIPQVSKEELLKNFHNKHKRQFTRDMQRDWEKLNEN